MDQETIQKIAVELAKHLPSYPWAILAVQTLLMLLAGALVAYFGEYFKTRGKHLATKADFDEVLSQVRTNTELVETIRAEVSQKDWARREWTNLRRIKLEELLNQMHECEAHAQRHRNRAVEGKFFEEPDPVTKLQSLGELYFPELVTELRNYSLAYRDLIIAMLKLGRAVLQARTDRSAFDTAFAEFDADFDTKNPKMLTAANELKRAARRLLVKIVGIEG